MTLKGGTRGAHFFLAELLYVYLYCLTYSDENLHANRYGNGVLLTNQPSCCHIALLQCTNFWGPCKCLLFDLQWPNSSSSSSSSSSYRKR